MPLSIASWLGAISWPLVSRVLKSMGFGVITYIGISTALTAALSASKDAFGGITGDLLAYLAIAGLFKAASIVAGALIASVAFVSLKKFSILNSGT